MATEYYELARHPNSAALREYSRTAIARLLAGNAPPQAAIEIGVGRPILNSTVKWQSTFVIGLDSSPEMLAHAYGVVDASVVAAAANLPIAGSTVDLIVASLGDPYNELGFWAEAARVLRPGGQVVLTSPTVEWARSVRDPESLSTTSFETRLGRVVAPSNVLTRFEQEALCARAGLRVDALIEVPREPVPYSWIAPAIDGRPANLPIVIGVRAMRAM